MALQKLVNTFRREVSVYRTLTFWPIFVSTVFDLINPWLPCHWFEFCVYPKPVSYTHLILREGASMFMVQKAVSKYGEMLIAPALIIIGIFMLDIIKLNLPKINIGGENLKKRTKGGWGAMLLGVFIRPRFLSYQWSILFRYTYTPVSSRNRRVSLACNLRYCYRITRNPCCMDFSVQCCRTG